MERVKEHVACWKHGWLFVLLCLRRLIVLNRLQTGFARVGTARADLDFLAPLRNFPWLFLLAFSLLKALGSFSTYLSCMNSEAIFGCVSKYETPFWMASKRKRRENHLPGSKFGETFVQDGGTGATRNVSTA